MVVTPIICRTSTPSRYLEEEGQGGGQKGESKEMFETKGQKEGSKRRVKGKGQKKCAGGEDGRVCLPPPPLLF